MKPAGSKQKGNNFERAICKYLSLWMSGGEKDAIYWRSANSGGVATQRHNKWKSSMVSGDICAIHPLGHTLLELFVIECKCVATLGIDLLAFDRTPPISDHWRQVCGDAAREKREPLLIAKQTRRPILCGVSGDMWQRMCVAIIEAPNASGRPRYIPPYIYTSHLDLCLVEFQPFFRGFTPEVMETLSNGEAVYS